MAVKVVDPVTAESKRSARPDKTPNGPRAKKHPISDAVLLSVRQRALFDLWLACRNGKPMPARQDVDVLDLKPWLGDLHMLKAEGDGSDFRYLIFGTNIAQYIGREMTGKLMSEAPEPRLAALTIASYRRVWQTGIPHLIKRPSVVTGFRVQQAVRDYLVLPLGEDGVRVNRLMVLLELHRLGNATSDFVEFFPLDGKTAAYAHSVVDLEREFYPETPTGHP
ncbi:MAG TPA: PAS domain-containing protein [Stellaceae bacterium]|nr:PAS domain-containing protein [Stellaceae bacterium]